MRRLAEAMICMGRIEGEYPLNPATSHLCPKCKEGQAMGTYCAVCEEVELSKYCGELEAQRFHKAVKDLNAAKGRIVNLLKDKANGL